MQPDKNQGPPTAQEAEPAAPRGDGKWLQRAQSAYRGSTSYIDTNYRKAWEDSIKAFNSEHPGDSKYSQPAYEKRSHLYRPKTRSVIRKNEAAAAAAFFSNMDVLSVTALDQSNEAQRASASVMKQLVEYRLDSSIPWFQIVLGGFQDAQTVGVAIAHVHWLWKAGKDQPKEQDVPRETPPDMGGMQLLQGGSPPGLDAPAAGGAQPHAPNAGNVVSLPQRHAPKFTPKPKLDKPCIDLVPIENFRFDPSANWLDPIGTSPYTIHLMPMYAQDVKSRMDSGEWNHYSAAQMVAASSGMTDSTRSARRKDGDDPYASDNRDIDEYAIVWVQRHIHKDGDEGDVEFYTLGDMYLLCDPLPLKDVVFHGERPYVCGTCVLETHKAIPSSLPQMAKGLQDEANEVVNQTLDNTKFVLNKKWFVKRGKEADVAGLVRNVPGGVVMLDDPANDVREITWPDVTQSAFETQNRIDRDQDELLGNFNPAAVMATGGNNSPARNMAMLGQSQGTLVEYLIRTYVVTFVLPVLKQLVKLEQEYETDRVILALAANRAQLFQRFGIDQVTDELLSQELTMKVDVGMGATDPTQKLQKLISGVTAFSNIVAKPAPGLNTNEVGKEIFACMGYQDGSRFLSNDNPQVAQLNQQLQQAMQQIQQLTQKLGEKHETNVFGLQKTRETNQSKLQMTQIKGQVDLQKEGMRQENENKRAVATHFTALMAPHSAPPKPEPKKAPKK